MTSEYYFFRNLECFAVDLWILYHSLFFFFHFCCLIVLVQSQSLSRRTTPFAPRVQVMGSVSLVFAHSLFTGLFFVFVFVSILWKMHSLGNGSAEFPFQCSLLRSFFQKKEFNFTLALKAAL